MMYLLMNYDVRPETADEVMNNTVQDHLIRGIRTFLSAAYPDCSDIQVYHTVRGRIGVHFRNARDGGFDEPPYCFFEVIVKNTGVFHSQWQLTELYMDYCTTRIGETNQRKIIRMRSLYWILLSGVGGMKKTADAHDEEMVDVLTEEDCLQYILHFLQDHFLPMAPVHGLK